MVVIQLSDAQVAEIVNHVRETMTEPERPATTTAGRAAATAADRDCVNSARRADDLVQTVLADLRALQVASRTADRREVESRVVAIIDGIENTIAED